MVEPAASPRPFRCIYEAEELPPHFRGAVVALGNFDGVHVGHQQLARLARDEARRRGVAAIAITFEPHPRTVFDPASPVFRLTPLPAKERLLRALGLDGVLVIPFSLDFASRTAEQFAEALLAGTLNASAVAIGYNFHFGRKRQGSPTFLMEAGGRLGFSVFIVPPIADAWGEPYSSFRVRGALEAGEIAVANELLGYRWFVEAEVVHGDARGRELGFPTANMKLEPDCRLRHGIYAVKALLPDGRLVDGVASFGRRPTFDDGQPLLEPYLFDFSGSLYGQKLRVTFIDWIREERRFDSVPALIAQINRDVEDARRINASAGPGTELDRHLAEIR
jgi:riboflavin kinase/FMN adenylyltransferase